MGMKFILTESQLARLEDKVGKIEPTEGAFGGGKMSCSNIRFDSLMDFLGNREEKKIGYQTVVHKFKNYNTNEVNLAIRHHDTDILVIKPNDSVIVDVGSWTSKTTKERLNTFLRCYNVYISQKNYEWFIHTPYKETIPYTNGVEILPDGHILNAKTKELSRWEVERQKEKMRSLNIDPKFRELYGISDNETDKESN